MTQIKFVLKYFAPFISCLVLQSLIEFYDDAHRDGGRPPNEAEFRAYHILAHLRDPDVAHQLERQADHILDAPIVQTALDIRAVAQRNNMAKTRRSANTEAAQNHFSRFFSLIARPSTPFLLACLLEAHFNDVRKGAFKTLKNSILEALKPFPVHTVTEMLGFNDDDDTASFASALSLPVVADPESGVPVAIKLNKKTVLGGRSDTITIVDGPLTCLFLFAEGAIIPPSKSIRLVSSKRAGRSHAEYIDGLVSTTADTPVVPPSPVTRVAALFPHRRPSSARSVTPTFSPGPLSPFRASAVNDRRTESSAPLPTPMTTQPSHAPHNGGSIFGRSSFFGPQPSPPTSPQTAIPSTSSNPTPFVWQSFPTSHPTQNPFTTTQSIVIPTIPETPLAEGRPRPTPTPFRSPASHKDSDVPAVPRSTQQTPFPHTLESKAIVKSPRIPRRSSSLHARSSLPLNTLPSLTTPQVIDSPKSFTNPQPTRSQVENEASAPQRRLQEIETLFLSTFDLMANAWIALQCRNAVADAQRNRRLLQRFMRLWLDRVIDLARIQNAVDDSRAELRRAIKRASWGVADDDTTITASRASSVTVDYSRSRCPIEDEEYVRSLESVRSSRFSTHLSFRRICSPY